MAALPTAEQLVLELRRAKVVDVPAERIAAAHEMLTRNNGLVAFPIAEGVPAIAGRDGHIEWLFDPESEREKPGTIGDRDRIDFRERQAFVEVQAGQTIAVWTPPIPGTPGRDVFGRPIPAAKLVDNQLQAGKNVVLAAGGREAVAQLAGHAFMGGRRASVDRLHQVRGNLDYREGNIHYPGNVEIQGDVLPGFRVEADGNISVGGVVDGAELRATGSVVVRGGIVNGARVLVHEDLDARYVLGAYLECGGDITIRESLLHSIVGDCARLEVTSRSGWRGVGGGRTNSRGNIVAFCLGTRAGLKTTLSVGTSAKDLLARRRLEGRLTEKQRDVERLQRLLTAHASPPGQRVSPGYEKLLTVLGAARLALENSTVELAELEARSRTWLGAQVKAFGTVHEGVEIGFGEKKYRVKATAGHVSFSWDEAQEAIVEKRL